MKLATPLACGGRRRIVPQFRRRRPWARLPPLRYLVAVSERADAFVGRASTGYGSELLDGRRHRSVHYASLPSPLLGRPGSVRCSVLLRRGGALRFRGLLAFFTWPGTWATSLKILSLGSPAGTVVVLPFPDGFVGFRLRVLAVGAEELVFWIGAHLTWLSCVACGRQSQRWIQKCAL